MKLMGPYLSDKDSKYGFYQNVTSEPNVNKRTTVIKVLEVSESFRKTKPAIVYTRRKISGEELSDHFFTRYKDKSTIVVYTGGPSREQKPNVGSRSPPKRGPFKIHSSFSDT